MPIIAIRINEAAGVSIDKDGEIIEEDDSEFISATEAIVWVDTDDVWDIENGLMDVRDILNGWTNSSEAEQL